MKIKLKPLLLLLLPVAAVVAFSYYLQGIIIANQEEFTKWLANFGSYVILVYVLLQVISIILAPIGGTVLIIGMIALFGPAFALILAYFVINPTYLINFWLARRYGRPFVERIVGKMAMAKVDQYVADAGIPTLILLRLFFGGYFDYLSYGIGLTKVPFKTFALIIFLAGIPSSVLYYLVFSTSDNLISGILTFYGITAVCTVVIIILTHYLRKRKKAARELK